MKSVHGFFELIAALTLILCLSGCASATLKVEKEIPVPPTQPFSLTLTIAEGVRLSAEDMNNLRAIIVDGLAWEGLHVGYNNKFKVVGTVTRYDQGIQLLRPLTPGYFGSTWVVLDENDSEIGKAQIDGDVYGGRLGGNYDRVLQNVGERLAEFLTKMHEVPKPKKERAE